MKDNGLEVLDHPETLPTDSDCLEPGPRKPARQKSSRRRCRASPPQAPAPCAEPAEGHAPPAPGRVGWVLDLRPESPFRPPSWRWQLALYQLDRGVTLPFADNLIQQAVGFLKELRACEGEADRRRLAERRPELAEAHALFTEEPPHRSWIIEALLLAEVPPAEIAGRMNISPPVIDLYEKLYFNALDCLGAGGYISNVVLRLHPRPDPDIGNVLRAYARKGGPLVLEALLRLLLPHVPYTSGKLPGDCMRPGSLEALQAKVNLATWLVPVTARTGPRIVRLNLALLEQERCHGRRPESEQVRRRNLNRTLHQLYRLLVAELD